METTAQRQALPPSAARGDSSGAAARGRAAAGADPGLQRRPIVAPFARALGVLAAFTPHERWLGNGELTVRTGLPASTVTRIAQSLVSLGYLVHAPAQRKYRLGPAVLALGYGAQANSDVQRIARDRMQAFAQQHRVHVVLSQRERLDLITLESCRPAVSDLTLKLDVGTRVGIAASPMGWALLAALPDLERHYLIDSVERRSPRDWPRLRRRANEAMAQVGEHGFCSSLGEWDSELGIVAVPLVLQDRPLMVLACVGAQSLLSRPRVERELGPRLLALAQGIQQTELRP